jgi:hypothetical protein
MKPGLHSALMKTALLVTMLAIAPVARGEKYDAPSFESFDKRANPSGSG